MSILKLVSKKDGMVLASIEVTESLEQAKLNLWPKIMRQLKLKWVEEEISNATS